MVVPAFVTVFLDQATLDEIEVHVFPSSDEGTPITRVRLNEVVSLQNSGLSPVEVAETLEVIAQRVRDTADCFEARSLGVAS